MYWRSKDTKYFANHQINLIFYSFNPVFVGIKHKRRLFYNKSSGECAAKT